MNTRIEKGGKVYEVTFDEDGVLDTVVCDGKFLSLVNRVVRQILTNSDKIQRGQLPTGFTRVA
ncbi:MAG: hypothetical protein CMF22_12085 [Idiomarinaceae bacterium]|nr:hypothetical protein [Idiomarinaceae bacterium]|tara:strand:+ start:4757 stop:4945 length:189 start_codon:yes stop_codon:yes gene_type:complete